MDWVKEILGGVSPKLGVWRSFTLPLWEFINATEEGVRLNKRTCRYLSRKFGVSSFQVQKAARGLEKAKLLKKRGGVYYALSEDERNNPKVWGVSSW